MEAADHQVFVVARVGDECLQRSGIARQVLEPAAMADLEPEWPAALGILRTLVVFGILLRTRAVDGIEVERRTPGIGRGARLRPAAEPGSQIESQVVVDELAEERDASGVGRIVGIVQAQGGVKDQLRRAGGKVVLGVERTARRPKLEHRRCEFGAGRSEWRKRREQAAECSSPGGLPNAGGAAATAAATPPAARTSRRVIAERRWSAVVVMARTSPDGQPKRTGRRRAPPVDAVGRSHRTGEGCHSRINLQTGGVRYRTISG